MPGGITSADLQRDREYLRQKRPEAEEFWGINNNDFTQVNGHVSKKSRKMKESKQKTGSGFVQVIAVPENLQSTPSIFKKSNEEQFGEGTPALDSTLHNMYASSSKKKQRFNHSAKILGDEERNLEELALNAVEHDTKAVQNKNLNVIEPEKSDTEEQFTEKNVYETNQNANEPEMQIKSPVIETRRKKNATIHPYQVPHQNSFLLHIQHPSEFSFNGKMKITLLIGHIEIFGYSLAFDSKTHSADLYFPKFCSSPCIETKIPNVEADAEDINSFLDGLNLIEENDLRKLLKNFKPYDSLILVEEVTNSFVNVLEKYFNKSLFSELAIEASALADVAQSLKCVFNLNSSYITKELRKNPDWDMLPLKNCNMICGGKNVGKSTMLKYLINRAFSEHGGVVCLEFDPGQPEFTPPGCLSLVVLKEPVVGPNFTHIVEPEKMVFLGSVDVGQCPTSYLEAVSQIVKFYREDPVFSQMPCFVNSMGYCKGLGVALTISAIKLLKPDTLIQIESTDEKSNYPFHLSPDCLKYEEGFLFPTLEISDLTYEFHLLKSYAEEGGVKLVGGLKPRELRDLMLLSYFSQMVPISQPNFNSVQPYSISFSKLYLAVHDAVAHSDILKAFNGNMVALCQYEQLPSNEILEAEETDYFKILFKPNIMPCAGLGFVRGIDCTAKKIYVITHLSNFALESVNCLMLGAVSPPHSIYLKQDTVEGPIVYTSINTGDNIQRVKRTFKFTKNHTP